MAKKKGKSRLIVITVLVLLLIIVLGLAFILINDNSTGDGTVSDEIIYVEIPEGSSATAIGEILEENGLIKSADSFLVKSKLKNYDTRFQAGVYGLAVGMSDDEIMEIIATGQQSTQRVTIQEGLTVYEIADVVSEAGLCTREEFLFEVANGDYDYWFTEQLPAGQNRLEGYLFPDTYDFFMGASAYDVIDRMLSEFNEVFTEEYRTKAQQLGYTVHEIITIASMIEGETMVDEERPIVASVIYNRLNSGMRLQIDATVQYALGERKTRLFESDLQVDSPYNTYQNDGLPPGPICSPGKASIDAALNPASTNYLYYVLKPEMDGTHNFSATYEEFAANKNAYLATLN